MAASLTPSQVPFTGPYSVAGNGKHKGNTPLALKRAMARLEIIAWEPLIWDNVFNLKLEMALDVWDKGKDGYGEGRWVKIRMAKTKKGEFALDGECQRLIREEATKQVVFVPKLGPVFNGGASILQHDLTHPTTGIPLFPAFDDAFLTGTGVIAPEKLTVIGPDTSANPGEAFYALGASKIEYWIGHLDRDHKIGKTFAQGDFMGRVIATSKGGGPHCHWGINVERLFGVGKELVHHDNYTHGAPLIGDQLREWAESVA